MNENKQKSGLKNKLSVLKENNPSALIFMIIIFINIISIIFSSIILRFLPENEGRTIPQMLRAAFTLMVNPSGRYVYSDAPISLVITTFVVLFGMVSLTGGTVGYITSMISGVIEKSACSKNKLKLKNHIVILNYNHKVSSLICDYCFDDTKNTYIVILSEREKDEIQKQIDDAFAVKAKYFFDNYSDIPEFSSKKEMILWIYEATNHKYMPLGCIKNGINYLFARTENSSDGLDSTVLLSKDSSVPAFGTPDKLTLDPDDEIIVIKSN